MTNRFILFSLTFVAYLAGCAGPGPKMFPVVPTETRTDAGAAERLYDTHHDRKTDYCERLAADGHIGLLRFDTDHDGQFDMDVDRLKPGADDKHLIILLDSVPYSLMQELWEQGRFRLFFPPGRTICPFPVMTDLSFSEFFGESPSPGTESEYFDGSRLLDGYNVYVHERNARWLAHTDYHMIAFAHAAAYMWPEEWFNHELHFIQKYFCAGGKSPFIGYCVGTSALGARRGRNGHIVNLICVDRMCQEIMYRSRGRLQITLLSDHGHSLVPSQRVPLSEYLARCGYRVRSRLDRPDDVAVPEFGVVTCGAVYTHSPERVAHDLTLLEGVDQTMYLDSTDAVVVLTREGQARITKSADGYRYEAEKGDPLKMKPVLEDLTRQGKVDARGFVEDRVLFSATVECEYPDSIHRVWRAFHGLIEHQPDVMVTTRVGWHCGSKFMSSLVDVKGAHGDLGQASSSGFVMTTCGRLPAVTRMEDLRGELQRVGVPLKPPAARR